MGKFNASRGGAKPRMLDPQSKDFMISVGSSRKGGIYEIGYGGTVMARRVELPEWIEQARSKERKPLRKMLLEGLAAPKEEIGESRGHIYLRPPKELFGGPAVGLDMEAHAAFAADEKIQKLRFCAYAPGYRLVAAWEISREDYLAACKQAESKPPFMPQMMVELSALRDRPMI